MLLNILCDGQPPEQRIIQSKMSILPTLRNSDIEERSYTSVSLSIYINQYINIYQSMESLSLHWHSECSSLKQKFNVTGVLMHTFINFINNAHLY